MFKFKNKTIEEFRNEVLGFIGKEIELQNGEKRTLESVTANDVHYLSTLSGNFQFMPHNGEVDLGKALKGVKMYGFFATVSIKDGHGNKRENSELISVPFDSRNEKQFVVTSNDSSIIK